LGSLFDQHKVVVWHDDSGALGPLLRDGLPDGVQMPVFEGNPLSLRQMIDQNDPWLGGKWLLYIPTLPDGVTCDWLTDYEQGFCKLPQANLAWALREFFGMPETPDLRGLLRGVAGKALAEKFGQYFPGDRDRLEELDVLGGLLRAVIEAPAADAGELVLRYLTAESDEKRWRDLGLLPSLTTLIRSRLGLRRHLIEGNPPDRGALVRCLVASAIVDADAADARPLANHLPQEDFRPQWTHALRQALQDPARRAAIDATAAQVLGGSELVSSLTDPRRLTRGPALSTIDDRILGQLLDRHPSGEENVQEWWREVASVAAERLEQQVLDASMRMRWSVVRGAASLLGAVSQRLAMLVTYPAGAFDRLASDYVKPTDGDWRIDYFYRSLQLGETVLPAEWRGALLDPARQAYHRFCRELVAKFVGAVEAKGGYTADGFIAQRAFWAELVEPRTDVAVLLVDALRADLAYELKAMLEARGLRVEPQFVLAELPTRTEVGMAALLPRAHESFTVRAEAGRLVASIGPNRLPGTEDRRRYLEGILSQQGKQLRRAEVDAFIGQDGEPLGQCRAAGRLPVAHTRELDEGGEIAAGVSFEIFADILGKCATFAQFALGRGFAEVVIGTDHGFLLRDPEAAPGGVPGPGDASETMAVGLRYAVGSGPPGTGSIRLSPDALGRGGDDAVVPRDTACFARQGGPGLFVHGGLSPQECALVFLRVLPGVAATPLRPVPVRLEVPERVVTLAFPVSVIAEPVETPLFVRPRQVIVLALDSDGREAWRIQAPISVHPSTAKSVVPVPVVLSASGTYLLSLYDADGEVPIQASTVRVEGLGEDFGF
jgi:hypothetical protein